MPRLTLFIKGNLDVHDTLHSFRMGGTLRWNGINEIVRDRFPGTLVRMRHETFSRSDALLAARGQVPADLAARKLELNTYSAASQFSCEIFGTDADAIVLSIQPDIMTNLVRHRSEDYLLDPYNWQAWPADDQRWLSENFISSPLLDVGTSMANLEQVIARLRTHSATPILVYNLSSVVPGDNAHCHLGLETSLATRIRRFNLGLVELSQRTGISVIDVDAIVARAGAERMKLDAMHLTAEGCRLVAEDVVRVLDELGCFADAPPGTVKSRN